MNIKSIATKFASVVAAGAVALSLSAAASPEAHALGFLSSSSTSGRAPAVELRIPTPPPAPKPVPVKLDYIIPKPANPAPVPKPINPAPAPKPVDQGVNLNAEKNKQITKVNEYRVSKGLKPFQYSSKLANRAQTWANTMAANDNVNTSDFYSRWPHERPYAKANPGYNYVEMYDYENVYKVYDRKGLDNVVTGFKNSPGHNRNMLISGKSTSQPKIGIGIAKGDIDQYGRQSYYVVYKMTTD